MAGLVGKTMVLVFDRRAVARADAFDHAGIHRRTIEVGGNDLVRSRVGVSDPAADLRRVLLTIAHERHHRQRCVARLLGHKRKILGMTLDTWRPSGLLPTYPPRLLRQPVRSSESSFWKLFVSSVRFVLLWEFF